MLNVVTLMGRLTQDPELKTTNSGISVCSFSIAVNRNFVKQGEERTADFINIVTWRHTADFVCKYFAKGQLIALSGSIQTRNYEDKNGNKRTAFEVVADNVHFAEGKSNNNGDNGDKNKFMPNKFEASEEVMNFSSSDDDFIEITSDDDLPF